MAIFIVIVVVLIIAVYFIFNKKKTKIGSTTSDTSARFDEGLKQENQGLEDKRNSILSSFEKNDYSTPIEFKFNGLPYRFDEEHFTVFDFETADDNELSVVKLSISKFNGIRLLGIKEYIFSPATTSQNNENRYKYSHLHKIKPSDTEGKPTIIDEWHNIEQELSNQHLIAHNSEFDLKILQAIVNKVNKPLKGSTITCTLYYSKMFINWSWSRKLEDICKENKIPYWETKLKSVSTGILYIYLSTICTEKSYNLFITGKKLSLRPPKI